MIIGICDDDKVWGRRASHIIGEYRKKTSLDVEIQYFPDKESLLNYEGDPIEALFLDIELGDGNGIELAEEVHKKWSSCLIIFLTNHLSYATDVYRTEHIWFALKEQFQSRVGEIFDRILRCMEKQKKQIPFLCLNREMISFSPDDIYYLERTARKTQIGYSLGRL